MTTSFRDGRPHPRPAATQARDVHVDPRRLYSWITDVTRIPEWHPAIRRAAWTGGGRGAHPGARLRVWPRSWLGRSREWEIEVARPEAEFVMRARGHRREAARFGFTPVPGGTRLTYVPSGRGAAAADVLARIADAVEGRATVRQPRLGQAHTAEGPLDLSAMFVMHHGFRRDLRDFVRAVPVTPTTDAQSWAALARRWRNVATALHHHHRVEDRWIWPPLLEAADAAGDGAGREVLEAMEAEHATIDPVLDVCAGGFRAMLSSPDAASRDRLAADLGRARDVLGEHLAHEERAALPLAQAYLSVAAWKDSEIAARKEFGLADLGFTVPWSAREIPDDQFALAYAHGGTLVRAILAITRWRFEREHAVAFRYLPEALTDADRIRPTKIVGPRSG
jgi:hypothetical protein